VSTFGKLLDTTTLAKAVQDFTNDTSTKHARYSTSCSSPINKAGEQQYVLVGLAQLARSTFLSFIVAYDGYQAEPVALGVASTDTSSLIVAGRPLPWFEATG
jgi:hypothetical protein